MVEQSGEKKKMKPLKSIGLCFLTAAFIWVFYLSTIHYGEARYNMGMSDGAKIGYKMGIMSCKKHTRYDSAIEAAMVWPTPES